MNEKQNPAKEYLNRYRHLVNRRESLLREIDIIRARATNTTIRIKEVSVMSSSKIHDQIAEDAAMLSPQASPPPTPGPLGRWAVFYIATTTVGLACTQNVNSSHWGTLSSL